jgi:Uma2 family endonuclease
MSIGDPGTKLSHQPDVLRGPDVGLVGSAREPVGQGEQGWLEGAPDLVCEVKGDPQSTADLTRKALEYLRAGAKYVCALDDAAKELLLFTPPDHVQVLASDDAVEAPDLLPGFSSQGRRLLPLTGGLRRLESSRAPAGRSQGLPALKFSAARSAGRSATTPRPSP